MARKSSRVAAPRKKRDQLSYEAIADAYRQELCAMPGAAPSPTTTLSASGGSSEGAG